MVLEWAENHGILDGSADHTDLFRCKPGLIPAADGPEQYMPALRRLLPVSGP